eukprot:jgi/Astpho2/5403/Aster-x1291
MLHISPTYSSGEALDTKVKGSREQQPIPLLEQESGSLSGSLSDDLDAAQEQQQIDKDGVQNGVQEIPADQVHICKHPDGQDWVLGEGSYGTVFRGVWVSPKGRKDVAVKQFKGISLPSDEMKELSFLQTCRHKNIITFYGVVRKPNEVLLVTELMELGDLGQAIRRDPETWGWHGRGKAVALDIACGLRFLHTAKPNPILHLDLKSGNVLLAGNGTAKLGDFGLARAFTQSHVARGCTSFPGTFAYAAPEIFLNQTCTPASDIFSCGITLWEICSGKVPERGRLRDIRAPEEAPLEIVQLVDRCLDRNPALRPDALKVIQTISASLYRGCHQVQQADLRPLSAELQQLVDPEGDTEAKVAAARHLVQLCARGGAARVQAGLREGEHLPAMLALLAEPRSELASLLAGLLYSLVALGSTDFNHDLVKQGGLDCLVQLLNGGGLHAETWAAGVLHWLAFASQEHAAAIAQEAIPGLVALLSQGSAVAQTEAAGTLWRLALGAPRRAADMFAADAVRHLTLLVAGGSVATQTNAAGALWAFATASEDHAVAMTSRECVRALVDLLKFGRAQAQEVAAGALGQLAARSGEGKRETVEAGGVAALVQVMSNSSPAAEARAARALASLAESAGALANMAAGPEECRRALLQAQAAQPLVWLLSQGSAKAQCYSAVALRNWAAGSPSDQAAILEAGGVPALLALLGCGAAETQSNAAGALANLSAASAACKGVICANAEGLHDLIGLLSGHSPTAQANAAACLRNLSAGPEPRQAALSPAIQPLVDLATTGSNMAATASAAAALRNLAVGSPQRSATIRFLMLMSGQQVPGASAASMDACRGRPRMPEPRDAVAAPAEHSWSPHMHQLPAWSAVPAGAKSPIFLAASVIRRLIPHSVRLRR